MATLAIVLSALGGACELAGLGVVIAEISSDRQRAKRLLVPRRPLNQPERKYPPTTLPSSLPVSNPLFSSAQQQQDLLKFVRRLESSTANILIGIRKAVDAELDHAVRLLYEEIGNGDELLRRNLREILVGGIRVRALGAALVALGIALGTAGSILGNLP